MYKQGKKIEADTFKNEEQSAFSERGFHLVNSSVLIEVNAYDLVHSETGKHRDIIVVEDKTMNEFHYTPEEARRAEGIEVRYVYDDLKTALEDVAARIQQVYLNAYPNMEGWGP